MTAVGTQSSAATIPVTLECIKIILVGIVLDFVVPLGANNTFSRGHYYFSSYFYGSYVYEWSNTYFWYDNAVYIYVRCYNDSSSPVPGVALYSTWTFRNHP